MFELLSIGGLLSIAIIRLFIVIIAFDIHHLQRFQVKFKQQYLYQKKYYLIMVQVYYSFIYEFNSIIGISKGSYFTSGSEFVLTNKNIWMPAAVQFLAANLWR